MDDSFEDDEDAAVLTLFQEPDGFYQPKKPYSHQSFKLADGRQLDVRLVGHNPLWGHLLWNGARHLSHYLQDPVQRTSLVQNRTILEFGAGAGLPSLVCAALGAARVVVTDYPDADLIENLRWNIDHCRPLLGPPQGSNNRATQEDSIVAEGYLWGQDVTPLTKHVLALESQSTEETGGEVERGTFQTLLLADLLFNHSEHAKLIKSIRLTLSRTRDARALVFFTPYRPWLLEKDLAFFDLMLASNDNPQEPGSGGALAFTKLFERELDKSMFEDDPGDEKLKRTIFAFELFWADLQQH